MASVAPTKPSDPIIPSGMPSSGSGVNPIVFPPSRPDGASPLNGARVQVLTDLKKLVNILIKLKFLEDKSGNEFKIQPNAPFQRTLENLASAVHKSDAFNKLPVKNFLMPEARAEQVLQAIQGEDPNARYAEELSLYIETAYDFDKQIANKAILRLIGKGKLDLAVSILDKLMGFDHERVQNYKANKSIDFETRAYYATLIAKEYAKGGLVAKATALIDNARAHMNQSAQTLQVHGYQNNYDKDRASELHSIAYILGKKGFVDASISIMEQTVGHCQKDQIIGNVEYILRENPPQSQKFIQFLHKISSTEGEWIKIAKFLTEQERIDQLLPFLQRVSVPTQKTIIQACIDVPFIYKKNRANGLRLLHLLLDNQFSPEQDMLRDFLVTLLMEEKMAEAISLIDKIPSADKADFLPSFAFRAVHKIMTTFRDRHSLFTFLGKIPEHAMKEAIRKELSFKIPELNARPSMPDPSPAADMDPLPHRPEPIHPPINVAPALTRADYGKALVVKLWESSILYQILSISTVGLVPLVTFLFGYFFRLSM